MGAIAGASYNTVQNALNAGYYTTQGMKELAGMENNFNADSYMRTMRKLTPFQNHFAFRQGLNYLESGAAQMMGGTGQYALPEHVRAQAEAPF